MTSSINAAGAEFRRALGRFATGVTIVTTRDAAGKDVGLTANSFSSVSLDPPMVLWSLSRRSLSLPAFMQAEHFAVHVLASDQDELASRFATRGADKFAGLILQRGQDDIALLADCAARFQCRSTIKHEGGDHVIFVGEVLHFDHTERPPLIFHGGRYVR
jgi:3-hydroxy-9,10-secoandrosta-1,3,5(10)-triene-9,17-dione monooxygenase reductase component